MNEENKDFVGQGLDGKDAKSIATSSSEKIAEKTDTENISAIGKNIKVNEMDGLLFETPRGGIMTKEVGTITGPVELFIENDVARIRYEGALDIYTVAGKVNGRSLQEVAQILTSDLGIGEDGNPRFTSLMEGDEFDTLDDEVEAPPLDPNEQYYYCSNCDYAYNPEYGDPDSAVSAGKTFEQIPADWTCPSCGATKDQFELR